MSWVYCVCFVGDRFVMVYNEARKGWEMPGGRIEPGETAERAAVREVREECGCDMEPFAHMDRRDGKVFCGDLCCAADLEGKGEMRWDLYSDLPSPLAFGEDEYQEVLAWARRALQEHRASSHGFRSRL
jgi:8-oxo-dGTP pyrophosphatase MutT (NUDIX family)